MSNDYTINKQARQLWQNYVPGNKLNQAGREKFWKQYQKIKSVARQNRKEFLAKNPRKQPAKKVSLVGTTLMLSPKNQRKYKNLMKLWTLGIWLLMMLIVQVSCWLIYVIMEAFMETRKLDPKIVRLAYLLVYLIITIPAYWVARFNAYRYVEIKKEGLLTGGKLLRKRKISWKSVHKIEINARHLVVYYSGKGKGIHQVEIPRLIDRFDELKAYLEEQIKNK